MMHIVYKSGYKYQLCETYQGMTGIEGHTVLTEWIDLDPIGQITIRKGYAWDGPSGPTFDTPAFMRGSLVHDALYQLLEEGLLNPELRIKADEALRRICIEDGMSRIRAWWVYRAVRGFGGSAINPKNNQMPKTAP